MVRGDAGPFAVPRKLRMPVHAWMVCTRVSDIGEAMMARALVSIVHAARALQIACLCQVGGALMRCLQAVPQTARRCVDHQATLGFFHNSPHCA